MFDWKKYKEKLLALRELIERERHFGADVDVELVLPEDPQFKLHKAVPYLLVRFEVSENITKERKIELFDYYLEKDTNELIKLITDMIEEFVAESESSEYGGG
jgi:predicted HTH domain antitoxin